MRREGYLTNEPFIIKTDHQYLKYIFEQKEFDPTVKKLMGHQYSLMYEPKETVNHTLYLKTEMLMVNSLKIIFLRMKTKPHSRQAKN